MLELLLLIACHMQSKRTRPYIGGELRLDEVIGGSTLRRRALRPDINVSLSLLKSCLSLMKNVHVKNIDIMRNSSAPVAVFGTFGRRF